MRLLAPYLTAEQRAKRLRMLEVNHIVEQGDNDVGVTSDLGYPLEYMKSYSVALIALALSTLGCSREQHSKSTKQVSAAAVSASAVQSDVEPRSDAASVATATAIQSHRAQHRLTANVVFAERRGSNTSQFRIHRLGSEVLVTHGEDVFRFTGDYLEPEPLKADGIVIGDIVWLTGVWRGYFYGVADLRTPTGSYMPETFIRGFRNGFEYGFDEAPAIWSKGRILRLKGGVFETNQATGDAELPKVALGSSVECATRFVPLHMSAAVDGRVLAVGPSCEQKGMLAIEMWDGAGGEGKLQLLPGSNVLPAEDDCVTPPCSGRRLADPPKIRVLLGAKRGAYIVASTNTLSAIWREQADSWERIDTKEILEIWSVSMDRRGALWAVTKSEKAEVVRLQGDTWTPVDLVSANEARNRIEDWPPNEAPLALVPTSYITSDSGGLIGANLVAGGSRRVAGVILEVAGAAPTAAVGSPVTPR